jgi:hypothetical protein
MAPTPDVLFSNYERQVHAHAPDPVKRQIAMLAARNDALAGTFGLNEEVFDAAEAQELSSLHTHNFTCSAGSAQLSATGGFKGVKTCRQPAPGKRRNRRRCCGNPPCRPGSFRASG